MSDLGQALAADTLRLERLLPGPIERVWAYLTEDEKLGQWFAAGTIEPRVGGKVRLVFDHDNISDERYPEPYRKYKGEKLLGEVIRYEPPHAIAYTWSDPGPRVSEVTFELSAKGSDVLLVVTHRKVANRQDMTSFASGWHSHVDILEDILRENARRAFWTNFTRLEAQYTKLLAARKARTA